MTLTARPYVPPPPPRHLPEPRRVGMDAQPVSVVRWVDRDELHANGYNPNRHATPELVLLAVSIIEDGWTQPLVARLDGEIVDGFHRWTVAGWPAIARMTDGQVPVVYLPDDVDVAQQMMSTVRHNRARGSHYVLSMADLLAQIVREHGVSEEEAGRRLGMEGEEVRRLLDRGDMLRRGANPDGFNHGWAPTTKETG